MKRNLLFSALLVLCLSVMAQAEDHTKFIRTYGGIVATGEQIENKQVYGTFRADGLIKTFKHIYTVVGFQDILTGEIDGENYGLGVCYFSRDPNSPKPQIYLLADNGITHTGGKGDDLGEYTYGAGFGFLVPWAWLDVTLMGQFKVMQIENDRLFHIGFGIQSGVDL